MLKDWPFDARDGLAVKNTGYSFRERNWIPSPIPWLTTLYVTVVTEDLMPSSGFLRYTQKINIF